MMSWPALAAAQDIAGVDRAHASPPPRAAEGAMITPPVA